MSRPLVAAGASASNNWGAASASTGLEVTGRAQLKRGINIEVGLSALASADATFSEFISATARGNAFASARAGAQMQLPLNLFDRFGIIVGAQAEAQAAAGIEVGLGLSIADFVALARIDEDDVGLPIAMLLLLIDEVDVQARFEVSVAAAAMAYATWQVTGCVIDQPGRPAGFTYRVSAGLGCAAGVGFSGGAAVPFKNFRRFYGRTTDLVVDDTLRSVRALIPETATDLHGPLCAMAPVVKIALRTAYELGDYIAKNAPRNSGKEMADLANHCVGIVLEEVQRFTFERMVEAALRELQALATSTAAALGSAWDALMPQRQALADVLYQMPGNPFQPDPENLRYWRDLVLAGSDLATRLSGDAASDMQRATAIAYGASELLIELVASNVNQPQAYALAIGAGVVRTKPSFGGAVRRPPPAPIKAFIRARIGGPANQALDLADLVQFLIDDIAIDALRRAVPEIDAFWQIFKGPIAATENEVIRLLLRHRHAFLTPGTNTGEADPVGTLDVLLGALDGFLETTVKQLVVPQVNEHIDDPNVRLYFNEVLVETTLYAKDIAFRTILHWQQRPLGRDEFTEALACVLVSLFGRTVVLFGDTLIAAVSGEMAQGCQHAAQRLQGPNGALARLGLPDNALNRELARTVLSIGAIVFEPLPVATRARTREFFYDAIEVIPPGAAEDFAQELADQFFIPNQERLSALMDELLEQTRQRFEKFIGLMFESSGAIVDAAVQQFLGDLALLIAEFERRLDAALDALRAELDLLARELEALAAQIDAAKAKFERELETLLESLAHPAMRDKLRSRIGDRFSDLAIAELKRNPFYKALPLSGIKRAARQLVDGVARAAVDTPLVDPVFDAIGAIASVADDIVDDAQSLDPREPLTSQLLGLILDRLEDLVREAFGGTPHINLSTTLNFEFFGPKSVTFGLGRIDLPFSELFGAMTSAVNALHFYEDALDDAAQALTDSFAKTLLQDAKRREQAKKTVRQARLGRIKAEQAPRERTVAILEPRAMTTYRRDVTARIHLGGVPASFLGLDTDEQQRVFVWVNGVLVPPKSIVLGEPIGSVSPADHARDFQLPATGTTSARGSIVVRNGGPKANGANGTRNALMARSGRAATPSSLRQLDDSLGDGLDLAIVLPIADLDQGTNTLTVVLLDVGGLRYAKTVSFAAAPSKRIRIAAGQPRLPTAAAVPRSAPRSRPTGQVDVATVTAALTQSVVYAKGQSAMNVRPAPRRGRRGDPR
ncbi:MAG TPA: hypothetical protein VNE58_12860 [Casimicrobiaceae bacterium]|nr:hypothetical protein [Casimicrobiaceae bacterium]